MWWIAFLLIAFLSPATVLWIGGFFMLACVIVYPIVIIIWWAERCDRKEQLKEQERRKRLGY